MWVATAGALVVALGVIYLIVSMRPPGESVPPIAAPSPVVATPEPRVNAKATPLATPAPVVNVPLVTPAPTQAPVSFPAHPATPAPTALPRLTPRTTTVAILRTTPTPRAAAPTSAPMPPTPAPTPAPASELGEVKIVVVPWADVSIDGTDYGTTPITRRIMLTPGWHAIRLTHTDYKPLIKRVQIRPGQATPLNITINMKDEAFPK